VEYLGRYRRAARVELTVLLVAGKLNNLGRYRRAARVELTVLIVAGKLNNCKPSETIQVDEIFKNSTGKKIRRKQHSRGIWVAGNVSVEDLVQVLAPFLRDPTGAPD